MCVSVHVPCVCRRVCVCESDDSDVSASSEYCGHLERTWLSLCGDGSPGRLLSREGTCLSQGCTASPWLPVENVCRVKAEVGKPVRRRLCQLRRRTVLWRGPRRRQGTGEIRLPFGCSSPGSCSVFWLRGQQTCSVKGHTVNLAGFSADSPSVTSQLCHCSIEGAAGST